MTSFIFGVIGIFVAVLVVGLSVWVNTKNSKQQDAAFADYVLLSKLINKTFLVKYRGRNFNVRVDVEYIQGTNLNDLILRFYVNDNHCFTSVKIINGTRSYFSSNVVRPYIEEEVRGILVATKDQIVKLLVVLNQTN